MLTRNDVQQLLALQAQAYRLLMWLADEASKDPQLLSPEAVAELREPETAALWLERHRLRLPGALVSYEALHPFASLLSSFFSTSFHVKHLEFEGRLVESRVTLGITEAPPVRGGLEQCQALALRHLASAEQMALAEKEARLLVRRKSLHDASLIWTYVWELDRRAKRKGKGTVVHKLWAALPRDARKSLDVERVWGARAQLVGAVRSMLEDPAA